MTGAPVTEIGPAGGIVLLFLGASLVLYALTAGADFGVGILECLTPGRRQRARLRQAGEKAIAPVWEANHIWIIVALVILFVGFPRLHVTLTTQLHIPLILMLVGIVLRGTAFTFRYYDVDQTDLQSTRLWTWLFRLGSLLVPLLFGHLAAATLRGTLPAAAHAQKAGSTTSYDLYLAPWLGLFPFATGLFACVLFAWVAAVFLVGEAKPSKRPSAARRARFWTAAAFVVGGLVTAAGLLEGVPGVVAIRQGTAPVATLAAGCATVALVLLWRDLGQQQTWRPRLLAGAAVVSILAGFWGQAFPVAVLFADGSTLTWTAALAPQATLQSLAASLLLGSALILPGLGWLYRLFKA